METKICKKCGRELSLNDFYVHKEMSDGHLNFCKDCVRSRVAKHREDNIERIREYDRNRPNAKERNREEKERIKQNPKRYERYKEQKREWRIKNKYKKQAHYQVQRALEQGKIIKPNKCEICGKINCEIQAHHYDYLKPLDVIWICTDCHGKVHRKYNKLDINIEEIKKNRI